jgi:hypothetical protein
MSTRIGLSLTSAQHDPTVRAATQKHPPRRPQSKIYASLFAGNLQVLDYSARDAYMV